MTLEIKEQALASREHSSPSDMGTANNHLSVTINEMEPHTAGSTITGTIYATIDEHAKKGIHDLTLHLIGKEDVGVVQYSTSRRNGHSSTSTSTSHEICDIVRMMMPVTDTRSPTGMQRGVHEFPFQVHLPATLPSSMSFRGDGGYARIRYKIKVEARRADGKGKPIAKEEVALEIVAKQPSNHVPTPKCIEPTSSDIRLFYCIPRGNISFTADVSDTSVGIGETVEIGLGCKNESETRIKFARASVMQKVNWCAHGHRSERKAYLTQGKFSLDDDTKTPRRGQIVGLPGETLDTLKNNCIFLKNNDDTKITLKIPPYALHSYVGKLISIEHKVKLNVMTPFGSTSPKGKVNIQIIPPRQNAAIACSSVQPNAPALVGEDQLWA